MLSATHAGNNSSFNKILGVGLSSCWSISSNSPSARQARQSPAEAQAEPKAEPLVGLNGLQQSLQPLSTLHPLGPRIRPGVLDERVILREANITSAGATHISEGCLRDLRGLSCLSVTQAVQSQSLPKALRTNLPADCSGSSSVQTRQR